MARPTMATLIEQVRALCGDEGTSTRMFKDERVERALDRTRENVRLCPLIAQDSLASGGAIEWKDFCMPGGGAFEDGALLQNSTGATLTPSSSEPLIGEWHFSAHQQDVVYITGKRYDLYAAAAELVEARIRDVASGFDFVADGLEVDRGSQVTALKSLAASLRAQQRVSAAALVRSDTV